MRKGRIGGISPELDDSVIPSRGKQVGIGGTPFYAVNIRAVRVFHLCELEKARLVLVWEGSFVGSSKDSNGIVGSPRGDQIFVRVPVDGKYRPRVMARKRAHVFPDKVPIDGDVYSKTVISRVSLP